MQLQPEVSVNKLVLEITKLALYITAARLVSLHMCTVLEFLCAIACFVHIVDTICIRL